MIGVESMPQPEAVSQERGTEQEGIAVERRDRPEPGTDVDREQKSIKAGDLAARSLRPVIKDMRNHAGAPQAHE